MIGTSKTVLDTKDKVAGYCWFTTEDGKFYIDWKNQNEQLQRSVLNAYHADGVVNGQNLAYVGFSSTPILYLAYDHKNSWAIERDGTNNQLKSH